MHPFCVSACEWGTPMHPSSTLVIQWVLAVGVSACDSRERLAERAQWGAQVCAAHDARHLHWRPDGRRRVSLAANGDVVCAARDQVSLVVGADLFSLCNWCRKLHIWSPNYTSTLALHKLRKWLRFGYAIATSVIRSYFLMRSYFLTCRRVQKVCGPACDTRASSLAIAMLVLVQT